MDLEWDETKRQDTLRERGLDFADVAQINFDLSTTIIDVRDDYGESRFVTYGFIEGRLHVVCWTRRRHRIRIISFRKANDREQKVIAAASRPSSAANG